MKRTWLIVFIVLFFNATAIAGESEGLSQQAMESVALQAREMSELGIPEAQAKKMLTQMVQNRFEKQNRIRAQQVVMDTAKAGLPTEPVMSKAMEGMAKQARQQQVIAAMETVQNRYARANRYARSLSENPKSIGTLTTAMADSMAAGMTVQDMDAVMSQLQVQVRSRQQTKNKVENDQLAIQSMQTVRTMARLGIPSPDVSDTVCQALQNQYTHQEMKQLRHQIATHASQQTPQQIANKHAGSIGKGDNAGGNSGAGGSGSGPGGSGSGSGGSGSGSGGSGSGAGGSGSGSGGAGSGSGGAGSGAGRS
jgi:hypothetical protein